MPAKMTDLDLNSMCPLRDSTSEWELQQYFKKTSRDKYYLIGLPQTMNLELFG